MVGYSHTPCVTSAGHTLQACHCCRQKGLQLGWCSPFCFGSEQSSRNVNSGLVSWGEGPK